MMRSASKVTENGEKAATLLQSPSGVAARGFSLLEFAGVIAVVTIVAAVSLPAVFKRLDRGAWTKESSDMNAISNAISLRILRTYSIPSEATWTNVADWAMRPPSQISTNSRRFARLFLYDQGSWLNGNLPYTQGQAGTGSGIPLNSRIVLLSTIGRALPYVNGALSTANFNSLWNAPQGTVPSYLTSLGWRGTGDDLVIQRIPIGPLFHRFILTTRDAPGAASFSINSTTIFSAVPSGAAGTNTYYIDGTSVGLASGTFTNRFVLTEDTSLTFEAGFFRNGILGDGTDNSITAQLFTSQARTFISTAGIPGSHQGADTQGALSAFYSFMYAYTIWANKCPHFQFTGNNGNSAVDYLILDKLGQNGSGGIINGSTGSGGGGLLQ